jgi:hypothetical protein
MSSQTPELEKNMLESAGWVSLRQGQSLPGTIPKLLKTDELVVD